MQHRESAIKIYFGSDYSTFNNIKGNRNLNETKIRKIIKDIENGTDVLRYCPILCIEKNGKLDIIDGQHRFEVSVRLKSKVWYILAEELSLYDIAKINSNTEKWKPKDFINCYKQLDNKNYSILDEIYKNYPVPLTTLISLLQAGKVSTGGTATDRFERGEFVIQYEDLTMDVLKGVNLFNIEGKWSRPFVGACLEVIKGKKITINDLANKVNKKPEGVITTGAPKQILTTLENAYNIGSHSRKVIY